MVITNFKSDCYSKIKITSPVSTDQSALTALRAGADALYIPLMVDIKKPDLLSLPLDNAAVIVRHIQKLRKQWYLSINTVVQEENIEKIFAMIEWANSLNCGAVLVSDIGILRILTDYYPDIAVFTGRLFNIHNIYGAKQLVGLGVKRITLSHELSLNEIEKIIKSVPGAEIEICVHGQNCFSSYGTCLLSSYTNRKSSNTGRCTYPCRIKCNYNDHKQFCLSVFDINAINLMKNISDIGVKSITFNGYDNKPDFLSKIIHAYRIVIDTIDTPYHKAVLKEAEKIVSYTLARQQSDGYLLGKRKKITENNYSGGNGRYIGEVKKGGTNRKITFAPHNNARIKKGDVLIIYDTDREIYSEETVNDFKKLSDGNYELFINRHIGPGSMIYLSTKSSYDNSITVNELNGIYHQYKIKNTAPKINRSRHNRRKQFKFDMTMYNTGKEPINKKTDLYVKFDNLKWDFILRDDRIKYNIVALNFELLEFVPKMIKNWSTFKNKIIFELPPLIFEDDVPAYEKVINELIKNKLQKFSLNNLSHFAMLLNKDTELFAGSQIVCLNRQALYFLNDRKIIQSTFCIESDVINLRKLTTSQNGSLFCLPIFYVPVIMRSRADISEAINNGSIISNSKNRFKVVRQNKNTILIPLNPVSLTHMLPRLSSLNIGAHIIDLSFLEPSEKVWDKIISSWGCCKSIGKISKFLKS